MKKSRLSEIVEQLNNEENIYYEPMKDKVESIYCSEAWEEQELEAVMNNVQSPEKYLIFCLDDMDMKDIFHGQDTNVIQVQPGSKFKEINSNKLELNLSDETSYVNLYNWINDNHIQIKEILNCFCLSKQEIPYQQLATYTTHFFLYISKHVLRGREWNVFFLYIPQNAIWNAMCRAVSGFFRVLSNENSRVACHSIELSSLNELTIELINQERISNNLEVRYVDGKRFIHKLALAEVNDNRAKRLVYEGTYLIIGGLGGLGTIIATHLICKWNARVIVCGRSYREEVMESVKSEIEEAGGDSNRLEFHACDITKEDDTENLISKMRELDIINGIIHCGATMNDSMITKKKIEDFDYVINPKINAVHQIEMIAKEFHSDFILYFSSIAAFVGTIGQCDYAYANSFLNHYAEEQKNSETKVISIAWPLWESKGMRAGKVVSDQIDKTGFAILPKEQGMNILDDIINSTKTGTVIIFYGKKESMFQVLGFTQKKKDWGENIMKMENHLQGNEKEKIYLYLKETIASVTKHQISEINDYEYFENLGIDSVKMIDIIMMMEEKLGSLPKTLFFEYQSLDQLEEFVEKNYIKLFQEQATIHETIIEPSSNLDTVGLQESDLLQYQGSVGKNYENEPIAIIGFDGKFPGADNMDEYWNVLSEGMDCIIEVPKERWDYQSFYSESDRKPGLTNCKWGGFINHPEYFDAEFFNYSPIEATMIDPQERIFLETVWNTMENAGYTRKELKKETVGVYVGVAWGHYQFYETQVEDYTLAPVSSFSSIANRVSYFLDLKGPSMAVDTMCSSSGTAIHLACESIRNGESTLAFAGGVNLTVHPTKYKVLSTKNYLSSEGKCRSFGEGGDGYVPGEGVGALLLKPLSKAIEDGDHVEAVILATGVNHGGKATGYSVPSPIAQGDLIKNTIQKANIKATDISYIEAHGTGTSLGDPIEIVGLSRGLNIDEQSGDEKYFIGSVKSNIGHLESAAAVSGIIKVILQMRHNEIVPSIHSQNLNKGIDFETLPFKVVQQLQPWGIKEEHKNKKMNLFSAVSSFGAGGSNSFTILGKAADELDKRIFLLDKQLVVISALSEQALHYNVNAIKDYVEQHQDMNSNTFIDMCYTLQTGREEMPYRIALVVNSVKDLLTELTNYLENKNSEHCYIGVIDKRNMAKNNQHMDETTDRHMNNYEMDQLAADWVQGKYIDWPQLYTQEMFQPRKLALPTYHYEKSKYWILDYNNKANRKVNVDLIHPMIDMNNSTMERQIYKKRFYGNELYLSNHVVNNKVLMPGAAFIELSRAASQLALVDIGTVKTMSHIEFRRPLIVESPVDVVVECYPKKGGLQFVIKEESSNKSIYCSGEISYLGNHINYIDEDYNYTEEELPASIEKEQLYSMLEQAGFHYGDYYRSIQRISLIDDKVIAKLEIEGNIANENSFYELKPSLIDSALQAAAILLNSVENGNKFIPSKIDNIIIYGAMTNSCTVVVKKVLGSESRYVFNIKLYDDQGHMCVEICNYTVEAYRKSEIKVEEVAQQKVQKNQVVDHEIRTKIAEFVKVSISKEIGADSGSLKESDDFEKYGVDSVITMRVTDRLNKVFHTLQATLLYEHKSVGSLVEFLFTDYYEVALQYFGDEDVKVQSKAMESEKEDSIYSNQSDSQQTYQKKYYYDGEDIAIIGIDGRYPQSENLEVFWGNLISGKDCIEEIPVERWDYRPLYSPDKNEKGKILSKWGGFISGAEEFDSEFFGIVPIQAAIMDPQERIYLQSAWNCIEDAGYTVKALENYTVGVYTGEMWGCYQKIGVEETLKGNVMSLSSSFASTSNKVSYIMNLHGPSMTVDTMCSSSLTAIHLACKAINDGSIDIAIAGGVNLSLHPDKYISLSQGKFLSSNGRCNSFGEGGDGYVPSEGVGTILLKRVSQAQKDGDHIYAVIKATSINHGGRSNAYFVPNVTEQKNLIVEALKNADISPRTISTVEAHGTGTALGDPIEVEGFNKAYRMYTTDKQYCAIGSVKSNIGHLESAAGIAAITKVVLELKHKKLVPSIHSDVLNSKIDFLNSPFFVQHKYEDWRKPLVNENGQLVEYPRRGAISAFGAGGTNVHIIMEEYEQEEDHRNIEETERIFVFSAKNMERLEELLQKFISYLGQQEFMSQLEENRFLYDLESNLLVGRQHFGYRIAIITKKLNELIDTIEAFLKNKKQKNLFTSGTDTNSIEADFFEDEDGIRYLETLIQKKNLSKIAKLWVNKVDFDYNTFVGAKYKKISMPTYSFEKHVIKPPKVKNEMQQQKVSLHSMVDNNVSKIENQQFVKQFTGNEFYLKDHVINGHSILPAAAYIEMFRASGGFSVQQGVVSKITNVVWQRPLILENNMIDAYINLTPEKDKVSCKIETVNEFGIHLSHCVGNLELVKDDPKWRSLETIDLNPYKELCTVEVAEIDFYKAFKKTNFVYGKRLQFIEKILVSASADCAITVLKDTNDLYEKEKYTLHPAILDSGIQSVATLINDETRSYLPYSVDSIEILDSLDNVKYVLVHNKNKVLDTISFDLDFVDGDGKVLLSFNHLSVKEQKVVEKEDLIKYFTTTIEKAEKLTLSHEQAKVVLIDTNKRLYDSMRQIGFDVLLVRLGDTKQKLSQTEYEIGISKEEDYKWVLQETISNSREVCVIYNIKVDERVNLDLNYASEFFLFVKSVVSSGFRNSLKLIHSFGGTIVSNDNMMVNPIYLACAGLLKTATIEMPKLCCKNIAFDDVICNNSEKLATYLLTELKFGNENVEEIYFSSDETRFVRALNNLSQETIVESAIKENGVYYIIGGLKGIGLKFAEYLAETYHVNLVISGRSELNLDNKKVIEHLEKESKSVLYIQADVNEPQDMVNSIGLIQSTYGSINGVIYSAGIKKDELMIHKSTETFNHVIETKTVGLQNTCKALENESVDFIVTFSSLAGLMGNMGQSDYAYANNYLDSYATVEGYNGKNIISINWPYWLDGGMRLKDNEIESMKKRNNMVPLQTKDALQAFEYAIAHIHSIHQLFVLALDNEQKEQVANEVKKEQKIENKPSVKETTESNGTQASEEAIAYLKNVISEETQIEVNRIKTNESFDSYGLDSVMIMNITANMEKEFGSLPKTLLYENHNIEELNEYLEESYSTEYYNLFGKSSVTQMESVDIENHQEKQVREDILEYTTEREKITFNHCIKAEEVNANYNEDMAIIGLVVKAPQADNINEYWDNLLNNRNCITEIPEDRWDYQTYYSETKGEVGKTYCKYGGFMNDVDKFDPLFFNIAPSNAAFIEPQERMMLQETWHLFENAGYPVSKLKNRDIGVFVGAMWQQYQMLLMNGPAQGMIPSLFSNLANRISSYYDLTGPSIAIDTMCSGSLTALHLAINSIRNGECSSAIVAGINTSIHPSKYINLAQGGLLSTDSRCKPFGKGADGYIPAEGLGLVMIKPLSQAIVDHDNIQIVIKASEIMHSGKGGGFMVPNPKAQAQVIEKAIKKANVPIQSINYFEAQGTCTEVGDAIEVKGMTAAYHTFSNDNQVCAIGSAKYHIGHAEAASGILAIAKIAMQMKNHLILGILNDDELNEDLLLEESPFYIPQNDCEWQPYNFNGESYPLTAGLNGFGGGGSYIHFILQEYRDRESKEKQMRKGPNAFILSAKDESALKRMVIHLKDYINSIFSLNLNKDHVFEEFTTMICNVTGVSTSVITENSLLTELNLSDKNCIQLLNEINTAFDLNMEYEDFINQLTIRDLVDNITCNGMHEDRVKLEQIAYSLQICRESMAERVVFVAESALELVNAIQKYLLQEKNQGIFYDASDGKTCDAELTSLVNEWMECKEVNWKNLYKFGTPMKLVLPEYPFAKDSYWLPKEIIMNQRTTNRDSKFANEQIKSSIYLESSTERDQIAEIIASILGIPIDTLDYDTSFKDYGLDSYLGLKISQVLSELYDCSIDFIYLEEHDTVNTLYETIHNDNMQLWKDDEVMNTKDNSELTKLLLKQLESGEIDVNEALKIEEGVIE